MFCIHLILYLLTFCLCGEEKNEKWLYFKEDVASYEKQNLKCSRKDRLVTNMHCSHATWWAMSAPVFLYILDITTERSSCRTPDSFPVYLGVLGVPFHFYVFKLSLLHPPKYKIKKNPTRRVGNSHNSYSSSTEISDGDI